MAKQKKKIKKERISFNAKIWIGLAVFIVASFGFFAFRISKAGADILNSKAYYYSIRTIISAVFIFLAFYKSKGKVPLYSSCFLIAFVILLWLEAFFIPTRIAVLMQFLWCITAVIVSVIAYLRMKDKKERHICRLDFSIMFVFLQNMLFLLYVKHVDNNAFLIASVIAGGIALIIAMSLVIIYKDRINEKQNRIWIPLCALLFTVVFAYMSLTTLNYCLDFSEPIIQSVEILDKDISSGSRQPTTFDLTVEINNKKVKIAVPSDIYYKYENGDLINISIYKGSLGKAYYFYDKALTE